MNYLREAQATFDDGEIIDFGSTRALVLHTPDIQQDIAHFTFRKKICFLPVNMPDKSRTLVR
jgi:hypothetical protein